MSIASELSDDKTVLTIQVVGRFDYSAHRDFKSSYDGHMKKVKKFILDLRETTYMDSTALGMLLLLRERAGGDSSDISIANANADIKKILTTSFFDKLFKIE